MTGAGQIGMAIARRMGYGYWVSVGGEKIPRFLIRDAFDEAETGWYYDMSDRIVKVKCKKPQKDDFEIVVSCEKFDLIGMENEI